ncbi:glutathione S-transferase family protein [Fontimonas sp. SYSU GA230001]|uniref:glutathione S-transferase family protein n=1 Tax=Fontimonas sp. SYSU GA230001 TaxID=3142450 RepID=UPI0032B55999
MAHRLLVMFTATADPPREIAMTAPALTLYTFAASQSSEKIRWTLDAAGLPYRECRLTPFFHHAEPLHLSGSLGVSIPTLEADGEFVEDSTAILEWLAQRCAPFALMPQDAERRRQVMRYEARMDHIGPHVVRYMYAQLLEDPDLVRRLWTLDAGRLHAALVRMTFPALRRMFHRGLGVAPALVEHSRKIVERALHELDQLVWSGRVYLVGEQLTVADITAAARLAPLVCPDEHPVFCDAEYRDAMAPLLSAWEARPAVAWVREIYRLHRRVRPVHVLREAPSAVEAFRLSRAFRTGTQL